MDYWEWDSIGREEPPNAFQSRYRGGEENWGDDISESEMRTKIETATKRHESYADQRSAVVALGDERGGLVCLNSAARFDKWNRAAVR